MNTRISRWPCWRATAWLALGLAIAGGCRKQSSKEEHVRDMPTEMRAALDPMHNTPLLIDGIESPQLVSADEAKLSFQTPVIGVVVDGQPRAYPLPRVSAMSTHVVNDVVPTTTGGQRPVTVTYCDMTDCVRVLTSLEVEGSLRIGTLGMLNRGLALRWNDRQFAQMDEVPGLEDVPFERVSWSEWRERYPETLVYEGRGSRTGTSRIGSPMNLPGPPYARPEQKSPALEQGQDSALRSSAAR